MNRICFPASSLLALCCLMLLTGCGDGGTNVGSRAKSNRASAFPDQPPMASIELAGVEFEAAIRLSTESGEMISVESPGYASPTMSDIDGDGVADLVVGQFKNGSMRVFRNEAANGEVPRFASPQWIESAGKPAMVPGIS